MAPRVVWTNGCFDVLHRGHVELLRYAKSLGASLYVGIDSDAKVKREKGASRPCNNQDDRKFLLESIKYVDKVEIFNSPEELETLIKKAKPFALVVGSDWRGKKVVGDQYAQVVDFFGRIGEYSTTTILGEDK
jgi:rfaE bifunctional protein nucleotidyltransferase chain/domain